MPSKFHKNKKKTHCSRGHRLTRDNVYTYSNSYSQCKICVKVNAKNSVDRRGKEIVNAYKRKWSKDNSNKILVWNKRRKENVLEFKIKVKAKPCTDCHNSFPHYVMDFDHIIGKKVYNISNCPTITALKRELKNCELVCANCHRIRTFNRRQHKSYPQEVFPDKLIK